MIWPKTVKAAVDRRSLRMITDEKRVSASRTHSTNLRNSNFDKAFTMTIKVKVTKLGLVWFLSPGTISRVKIGEKTCSDSARHRYQKWCDWKATKSPKIRFVMSSLPKFGYRQSMQNCSKNIAAKFHLDPTQTWNDGDVGFSQSRSQEQEDDYDQRYGTSSWSNKRNTRPPFLKNTAFGRCHTRFKKIL